MFVPDDDVVGPVDGGWTVARATLGNESVSIGGGAGRHVACPADALVAAFDAHPERLAGGAAPHRPLHRRPRRRWALLNLRSANRAVAGGGPGPGGRHHQAGAVRARPRGRRASSSDLSGPDAAFMDGAGGDERHAWC